MGVLKERFLLGSGLCPPASLLIAQGSCGLALSPARSLGKCVIAVQWALRFRIQHCFRALLFLVSVF